MIKEKDRYEMKTFEFVFTLEMSDPVLRVCSIWTVNSFLQTLDINLLTVVHCTISLIIKKIIRNNKKYRSPFW